MGIIVYLLFLVGVVYLAVDNVHAPRILLWLETHPRIWASGGFGLYNVFCAFVYVLEYYAYTDVGILLWWGWTISLPLGSISMVYCIHSMYVAGYRPVWCR